MVLRSSRSPFLLGIPPTPYSLLSLTLIALISIPALLDLVNLPPTREIDDRFSLP